MLKTTAVCFSAIFLASGCQTNRKSSEQKGVQDADVLVANDDGTFNITCKNADGSLNKELNVSADMVSRGNYCLPKPIQVPLDCVEERGRKKKKIKKNIEVQFPSKKMLKNQIGEIAILATDIENETPCDFVKFLKTPFRISGTFAGSTSNPSDLAPVGSSVECSARIHMSALTGPMKVSVETKKIVPSSSSGDNDVQLRCEGSVNVAD